MSETNETLATDGLSPPPRFTSVSDILSNFTPPSPIPFEYPDDEEVSQPAHKNANLMIRLPPFYLDHSLPAKANHRTLRAQPTILKSLPKIQQMTHPWKILLPMIIRTPIQPTPPGLVSNLNTNPSSPSNKSGRRCSS